MKAEKLKELLAQLIEEEAGKEAKEEEKTETVDKSSSDQKTEKSKEESTPSQSSGYDQRHSVNSSTCDNRNTSNCIRYIKDENPDIRWAKLMEVTCDENSLDSIRLAVRRWRA